MEADPIFACLQQPLPDVHERPRDAGGGSCLGMISSHLLNHKLSLEITQLFLRNVFSPFKSFWLFGSPNHGFDPKSRDSYIWPRTLW